MKELSEIIQELVDSSNSMNQIDSKTAIRYVVEAYEAGMDKAKELIKDSGEINYWRIKDPNSKPSLYRTGRYDSLVL